MQTLITRRQVVVRLGELRDAPAIARLRDEYYARFNLAVQYREDVFWYVAEVDGEVHACQSRFVGSCPGELWILDTYADPSRDGKAALGALAERLHGEADAYGLTLLGVTQLDNDAYNRAIQKRGWDCVGFLWRRAPRGT